MTGLATPPDAIPANPVKPTAAPGAPYVLAPHYMDRIKKFEGFTARPKWDAKQYSWGYGTRAPGPTGSITPEQADADLSREIGEAHGIVHSFAPRAPENVKAALTSLTYNSGGGWTKGAIGQAVARGDYAAAASLMPRYKVTSDGKFLPGLATRRAEEASWMTGAPTSPVTAPTATPASGSAPMALGMKQPPSQDQVNFYAKRGMAMMPDWNRPIGHWTQALGNMAQQISGSMWLDKAEKAMGDRREAENTAWGGMADAMVPGLSRPPTSSGATSAAASGFGPQGMTSPPPIDNPALAPQKPKVAPVQPAITGGQTATQAPAMRQQDDGRPAIAQAYPPVAESSTPMVTSTAPESAPAYETSAPAQQRNPLTPVSDHPQVAPADTRIDAIDQQIDTINGQVRALAPYLQNEATRTQAWQALQQLEQRRTHYEDMRLARSDPSEVMKRQQLELDIRSKKRELEEPQWDVVEIGKDKYGNPIKGWANKRTQEVRPIQPGMQQAGIDPNLHGEEFLKTLDPQMAATVKAIAEGRQPYPGAFAMKQPYWQKVTEYLSQYEPNADANLYRTRYATQRDIATGKMGQNIASFNTALGHMHDLYKQIDGLGNFDTMPILNGPINAVAGAVSGDAQARINTFNATKQKVIEETTKAFKGTGGTVHDLETAERELSSSASPAALKATVRKYLDLMKSRIEAIGDQYNRGMSAAQPRAAISLLSPHSQKIVSELEGGSGSGHAGNYMVGSPQPAPPPQAAPVDGAKQAPDGHWYLPDPQRPGKYLMVQ